MVMSCIPPIEWATLWDITEDEQGIDLLIEEVYMGLTPINCGLPGIDLTELNANLSALISAINGLAQGQTTQQGGCDMSNCCNCGCNNNGGEWPNTLPQYPTNPPEPSPEEVPPDVSWCKIAILTANSFETWLDLMTRYTWVVGGIIAILTIFSGPAGWSLSSLSVAAFVAALESSGTVGIHVFLTQTYSAYLGLKDDLICQIYNAPVHSAAGVKSAYYQWLRGNYVDGSPAFLLLTAIGMMVRWNTIYSADLSDVVGNCANCGEGQEPPTVPETYEIITTQAFFDTITSGNHAFTHSETLPNKAAIGADMSNNNEFLKVYFLAKGPQSLDASNGYMGAMIKLVSLTKSATPTDSTRIRKHPATKDDVNVGVVKQGQGMARLYTLDDPTAEGDLGPWLVSQGYRVTIDNSLGRDNDELNLPDRVDGLLPIEWSDKVSSGGQSGRINGTIEVNLIRVKL